MRRILFLSLALFLWTPPAWAQDEPSRVDDPAVRASIERILKLDEVARSRVGIHAVDVKTGEVLFSHHADQPFNPASNMKIVTGAAALDRLGPQFVFASRLSADRVDGSTIPGPLYLKSEGDPLIFYSDYLDWAVELEEQGIEKIAGGIVIDDTDFGGDFTAPGFDQKDEDASYRAPIGAVSAHFNAVTVLVSPAGEAGKPASVRMQPPNDYVEIVNEVKTTSGSRQRVQASAEAKGDTTLIRLSGSLGVDAADVHVRKRIDNPSLFAGSALRHALEQVGIEVEGEVRRGSRPEGTRTLVQHQSEPLSYIVLLMNKWSNNFIAEQVYRSLGRTEEGAATTEAARATVRDFMSSTKTDLDGFSTFNGSGLYDGNEITPRQLVALLDFMADHPNYPEFASSLAIGGVDGTLRSRFEQEETRGTLRGKTGTLNEVTALSGYLHTEGGRHVAYSILFNDTPVRAWRLRSVQDRIAAALAESEK